MRTQAPLDGTSMRRGERRKGGLGNARGGAAVVRLDGQGGTIGARQGGGISPPIFQASNLLSSGKSSPSPGGGTTPKQWSGQGLGPRGALPEAGAGKPQQ